MNPNGGLTYPAVLTPYLVHLANAGDIEGLKRLIVIGRALNEASAR